MKGMTLNSFDGTPIFVRVWDDAPNPKGIVQISHGMCEHSGRYTEFAELLQANGYIVFSDDHRCYGQTETAEGLGHHDGDIFEDTLSDLIFFNQYFSKLYNLPIVLFGHSYGSFLSQAFIQRGVPTKGVILAGTAYMGKALMYLGAGLLRLLPKKPRPAMFLKGSDLLFNGKYNPEKGPSLWTCSNAESRKAYLTDPMCNSPVSINFYYGMLKGLTTVTKEENIKRTDLDTPIAIFSGLDDPIGGVRSSKAKQLYLRYRRLGVKNLRLYLYENARHELVQEKNKKTYMNHMLSFVNRCFE